MIFINKGGVKFGKVLLPVITILFFSILLTDCQVKEKIPSENEMRDNWTEMNQSKQETYEWFNSSKFGMFIHFGLYSMPGGIWNGNKIETYNRPPNVAEWIQYVAQVPREEYARLAGEFNPVEYNADSIARLALDAGMKYIVITSKHHDGFAMYDSKVSEFDIVDATPFGRDILAELYTACKKYGIEFGIYYSHNIDWADGADCQYQEIYDLNKARGEEIPYFGANLWDPSANTFEEYIDNKAIPQVKELLTMFPGMKCLWYDMARFMYPQQSYRFYEVVYNIQPQMIITDRIGNDFGDYIITGDNLIPENTETIDRPWETVGTLNNSWGYKCYDNDWKSVEELLFWLVEIVSKGGNYMLNIGPKGDGSIPVESIHHLRKVGQWVKQNGEAIYGTSSWRVSHEGPTKILMKGTDEREKEGFNKSFTSEDFWFTQKENKIFVISFVRPKEKALIKNLGTDLAVDPKNVRALGFDSELEWKQLPEGLEVKIPDDIPGEYGYVLEVSL